VRFGRTPDYDLGLLAPTLQELHHVDLGELPPGAAFHYEVSIDGTDARRRGVFVTPGRASWRFAHLAEFHAPSMADKVARLAPALRDFAPHVVVESGDMVDIGDSLEHWRSYFRASAPWISNVLLLPAHSNHVNGSFGNAQVQDLFALPGNERWYATRVGQIQFFTLDSTFNGKNPDIAGDQITWLATERKRAAEADPQPLFVVGVWHYPACSSTYAQRASEHAWVLEHFIDTLVEAGGLDMVLVGHDKYYERSALDGRIVHVQANAGMLSPGTAGGNDARCRPIVTNLDTRSLVLFEVSGGQIRATTLNQHGAAIDAFTLQRDVGGPPELRP
jgi:hypothetical protein